MKVTYRREMKHNYLIVNPEALVWRSYECRMLALNAIEGVLHFQIRQLDDEIRFFYEITSKQPLARMLESKSLGGEELRRLVLGISRVLDRMELYLLREGCVLLKPEYIYVEPDTYRIWLCLVPGLERDFPEDYGKLLEYLLGKVDHQDKESVVLAYGLYQETRKENYGMEDILKLLGKGAAEAKEEKPAQLCGFPGPERRSAEVTEPVTEHKEIKAVQAGGESVFSRILKKIPGERKKREKEETPELPWEMMFVVGEEEEPYFPQEIKKKVDKSPAPPRALPLETTLLHGKNALEKKNERCLKSLMEGEEDIGIAYYPFVIGKQENLADYLLNRDTVSRLHVRIDREGEEYRIQDLNSTNGTMVNGRLLDNNETVKLEKGDEVNIAGYFYLFQ